MRKFQFFNASPLKMRACGTGRKFAELLNQRDEELQILMWIFSDLRGQRIGRPI
jgi:hypothetical protein